ncbi:MULTISPECIES: CGNR zinc finger domain-containing protein [unclassified Streptomyces]|uniref:CGNR zinc finger domain-containing protein n=1 Tax=unclassified Streptomyces TaxID=2593676 RepID=UPI0023492B11|nr:ABATE domain-containing protein [Streptomyces sp. M92]WCN01660.1 ABATE domain-containing protein [Streptomyces sp. M92]
MEFVFVSGSAALDFVGTVRSRRDAPLDSLVTPGDLAEWTVASGMLDGPPPVTEADLVSAVRLREAIYRVMLASISGSPLPAQDCAVLNRATARVPVRQELRPDGTALRSGSVRAVLATLSHDAVDLLVQRPTQVKECAAPSCTRLYVDHSRRSSRRWCDMMRCGNRAKAAAHRSRHHV